MFVLGLGSLASAAPGDVAPQWEGSTFDPPFDTGEHRVTARATDIAGRFLYAKSSPEQRIESATVSFADHGDGDASAAAGCELPPDTVTPGDDADIADNDELTFTAESISFSCNGVYDINATAMVQEDRQTITAVVTVVVPPDAARSVSASQLEPGVARVLWKEPKIVDPDALGYIVERSGPAAEDGSFGPYGPITDIIQVTGIDDRPPGDGAYVYRIRTVRKGPETPIASLAASSPTATSSIAGAATTTTTLFRAGGADITVPPTGPPPTLPPPPTTIDPGFDEILDYGEQPDRPTIDDFPELAGDESGLSVINADDGGAGLLVPAAGALVLLGWAGHLAYLNRLARRI